jgi:DNA-binding response OmpR family regulator
MDIERPGEAWPPFRVLCVDDNQDLADTTALLLKTVGFEACACYDGPTALDAAKSFHPSVCILDLNMPSMDGAELAVRLREQAKPNPVVLVAMTAMGTDEARVRIWEAGFNLHLVKPVSPAKLLEVVDALFRLAKPAQLSAGAGR